MARRSEHSRDEIKQMIFDAAENIIQERGYSALKIRQITADIGYTVASVYMVFASMDDLNTQIKTRTLQKIIATIAKQGTVQGKAKAYCDFAIQEPGLWKMLFQHQSVKRLDSEIEFFAMQQTLELSLTESLQKLKLAATEDESNTASTSLINAIQGACLSLLWSDVKKIESQVNLFLRCFLDGWRKL